MGIENRLLVAGLLVVALVASTGPSAVGQIAEDAAPMVKIDFCGPKTVPLDTAAGFQGRATIDDRAWRTAEIYYLVDGEPASGVSKADANGFFESWFRFQQPGEHTLQAVALLPAPDAGTSELARSEEIVVQVKEGGLSEALSIEIACYQVYDGPTGASEDTRVYAFVAGYVDGDQLDDEGWPNPLVEGTVRLVKDDHCWGPVICEKVASDQAHGFADPVNSVDTGFQAAVGPFSYDSSTNGVGDACDLIRHVEATARVPTVDGVAERSLETYAKMCTDNWVPNPANPVGP